MVIIIPNYNASNAGENGRSAEYFLQKQCCKIDINQ